MTQNPEISEETVPSEEAEDQARDGDVPQGTPGADASDQAPPPAGPRGADGESRVVAERSGSDTTFPARPLLADPDDARRVPGEDGPEIEDDSAGEGSGGTDEGDGNDTEITDGGAESAGDAEGSDGADGSGGTAEPEVGPAS
ncbi:hypothetical protein [Streptosporangium longisporum]|uniref:D-alanyl-D-alanine carboxypeptidase n=1 Tax=Streptosporangium longisporum TaxID=46187 RepID=A0ABP6LIG1_9ACTN